MVEAWGFRAMQSRGEAINRRQNALLWLETEYRPVVAMLREAGLVGDRTDAEAYMRIAGERYWLLRTHEWNDDGPPTGHRRQRTVAPPRALRHRSRRGTQFR